MSKGEATTKAPPRFMVLNDFFRIPSVGLTSKTDKKKKYSVQHRIGKIAEFGENKNEALSIPVLMAETKLEEELLKLGKKLERSFHDRKIFDKFFDSTHRDFTNRLRNWVKSFRAYLVNFYAPQGIRPIMNFVPDDDPREPVLYIQGFIDTATLTPVLGDIDDVTLAIEVKNAHLKAAVDEYRENQAIARRALEIPGVNKDIAGRLNQIVSGSIDKMQLLERFPKKEDEKK